MSDAQENITQGDEPIIRVEDCSVVFGRKARQALEMRRSGKSKAEVETETGSTIGVYQADFQVYPSEIFVVIGLSGSGKSTLLRAINASSSRRRGEFLLDGEYISEIGSRHLRQVRRKKIGMVFQHFGLLPTGPS